MKKPAVFLDRDGVINHDHGYVYKIEDFKWIDGSKEAIKYLKKKGYYVFVVTNQSGISRGYYQEKDVEILHQYINTELKEINTFIDDFFISPYHPDSKNKEYAHLSHLRKPNIGMLEIAEKKWSFEKGKSLMIGDKDSDIICAKNYGISGFLFKEENLLNFIKLKINI